MEFIICRGEISSMVWGGSCEAKVFSPRIRDIETDEGVNNLSVSPPTSIPRAKFRAVGSTLAPDSQRSFIRCDMITSSKAFPSLHPQDFDAIPKPTIEIPSAQPMGNKTQENPSRKNQSTDCLRPDRTLSRPNTSQPFS